MSNKAHTPDFIKVGVDLAGPNSADFSATALVLPTEAMKDLALALLAGARAIDNNTRLRGASFAKDFRGLNGGPHMITYYRAAELLEQVGQKMWEQIKEG